MQKAAHPPYCYYTVNKNITTITAEYFPQIYYHTSFQDPTLTVVLVSLGRHTLARSLCCYYRHKNKTDIGVAINAHQFRENLSQGSTDDM